MNIHACAIAAVAATPVLAGPPAYNYEIIARKGEIIGDRELRFLGGVAINDNGDVAFAGTGRDTVTGTNSSTIWTPSQVLAAAGEPVGGDILDDFFQATFEWNNNGDFAVVESLPSTPESVFTSAGRVLTSGDVVDGVTLTGAFDVNCQIADDGTVIVIAEADAGPGFGTTNVVMTQNQVLHIQGQTVGPITTGGIDLGGTFGILAADGNGTPYFFDQPDFSTPRSLLSPDTVIATERPGQGPLSVLSLNPSSNGLDASASGELVYIANLNGTAGAYSSQQGLFFEDETVIDGVTLITSAVRINDAGEVVLASVDNNSFDTVIHSPSDIVAQVGDVIDGLTLTSINTDYDTNNAGQVAFIADATDDMMTDIELVVVATPGPTPCSAADIAAPFGFLDLSDVQAFLIGFGTMDPCADLVEDNVFDLQDVQTFLINFGAGCP